MADKAKKGAIIKETPKAADVVMRETKPSKKDKETTSPALLRRLSIFGRKCVVNTLLTIISLDALVPMRITLHALIFP